LSKVRENNSDRDLFNEWMMLKSRADNMITFALGMVQNDYPGMTVDEVLEWKREVSRNLATFDDQVKRLLGKTLAFLLIDGEEEDDVPY
jgi:hypothetical protein